MFTYWILEKLLYKTFYVKEEYLFVFGFKCKSVPFFEFKKGLGEKECCSIY